MMLGQSVRPTALAAVRPHFLRPLSITVPRSQKDDSDDPLIKATTRAPEGAAGESEGKYARIDENVVIEYPDDENMPPSPVVQGRGGMHFKRTLAQFSLENRVTLVTGGARGLGLVMAQGIVASGSNLAIVDLNSMCNIQIGIDIAIADLITGDEAGESAQKLVDQFQKENPGLEEYASCALITRGHKFDADKCVPLACPRSPHTMPMSRTRTP